MNLVIVESPAKARTLESYLGAGFRVQASVGHVMDLPKKGLGVDVDNGFEPELVTIEGKDPLLRDLGKAAAEADSVLLAMDPDREGEAIAYHLVEALTARQRSLRGRFRRVTFNEITKSAVLKALERPGELDLPRIEAQQARRILDRLVGYGVSPVLWKKIKTGLSAGRVQSVAVRLLVERERARRTFRSGAWWRLRANLAADGGTFTADLAALDGVAIATGRDFDERTGTLKAGRKVVLLDRERAEALRARLTDALFTVARLQERRSKRSPYPPFTTATLQQEANRKLNFGARQTMGTAQKLYEAGHITYMRTDSVTIAEAAIAAIRTRVATRYGEEYLSPSPRRYKTKSRSAQEAHEAIRPAGTDMKTAAELGLTGPRKRLYELIWRRAVATQMADARLRHLTVHVDAEEARFRASGKVIEFPGFFRAYVEGSDDPNAALEDQETVLPDMREGQTLENRKLESRKHETKPPPRYTEASLVKELEADGIGRPSTYAAIISTVVDRGYALRQGKQLVPTFVAFAVNGLMEGHFPNLVDTGFTSEMEEALDEIARGNVDWRAYLGDFYRGRDGLEAQIAQGRAAIDPREASTVRLHDLTPSVRIGKWGPYLELRENGDRLTASLPDDVAPADLSEAQAMDLIRTKEKGADRLGEDTESGEIIYLKKGPFGPYVQRGEAVGGKKPKRASIRAPLRPEEVTLEVALKLLAMPTPLGKHPESGAPVKVGIGPFGPYVVHQRDFRSLTEDDDPLEMTFERAMEVLSMPKGKAALKEVGAHPEDGAPIAIYKGKWGPYVKHGKTNASLPKGTEIDEVTLDVAVDLLRKKKEVVAAKKAGKARKARKAGKAK